MGQSWSERTRQQDRDRKAVQRARQMRAREMRADNRRHMIQHPVSHAAGSLFRSIFGR